MQQPWLQNILDAVINTSGSPFHLNYNLFYSVNAFHNIFWVKIHQDASSQAQIPQT